MALRFIRRDNETETVTILLMNERYCSRRDLSAMVNTRVCLACFSGSFVFGSSVCGLVSPGLSSSPCHVDKLSRMGCSFLVVNSLWLSQFHMFSFHLAIQSHLSCYEPNTTIEVSSAEVTPILPPSRRASFCSV